VAIENAGFRNTMRAFQFTMAWGSTSFLGREPETIDEYAERVCCVRGGHVSSARLVGTVALSNASRTRASEGPRVTA
jgi:hypothetical protein